VSGGGDSLALMLAAAAWAAPRGVPLSVATVDHGLRPASAAEAAAVGARAAAAGLPHAVLRWAAPARGNLMAAAREGRRRLLAGWARDRGLSVVALGHTRDDQAETVLMALARGGSVAALAAMPEAARRDGVLWLRPLLGAGRAELRRWLADRGEGWADDPTNDDDRFERTRARRVLAALGPTGIDPARLAEVAAAAARADAALTAATDALAAASLREGPLGEARIDPAPLRAAPDEIALRLLARALAAARGGPVAPRAAALSRLLEAMRTLPAGRRTLAGCVVGWRRGAAFAAREPAALPRGAAGGVWDGRFAVLAAGPGAVRALGEAGLSALSAARAAGWTPAPGWDDAPRPARLAAPALWRDGALACAPHAGYGAGLEVRRTRPDDPCDPRRVDFGPPALT
jgi:tRNA(Ile)-lysidine synthase